MPATPFAATDDQSLFFARAVRIVQGQVPYRDFFEIVTPGTDLIYAVGFRLFGVHAWVMPMWTIATGLAFSLLITYIAAQIVHGPSVWLPALLFLVFDFNSALDLTHQWFSTFAALAMVAVLMGGLSGRRIFSAGLLCARGDSFHADERYAGCCGRCRLFCWGHKAAGHPSRQAACALHLLRLF